MSAGPRHILVLGAGVIGLSTAYYAARRGHRVTVLDRSPEQRDGCSFGNAGMVTPSHFVPLAAPGMVAMGLKWMWNPESPFWIKPRLDWELMSWGWRFWRAATRAHVLRAAPVLSELLLAGRACFEELAKLPGMDFGFATKGLLMLCKTEHTLEEEAKAAEFAHQLGMPAEVLGPKETAARDPNVRMDVAGSVYFPKDCHLIPAQFMSALKKQLDSLGVEFAWQQQVTGWRTGEQRIQAARTGQREWTADEFVLCGGSWSPGLVRELGLRLPMQPGKGYSLTLPNPRQLPSICAICTEARLAVTPMGAKLRFGGTMEMSGLNEEINPARIRGIIKAVPKYYPDFRPEDFEGVQPWRGLRPCSPDGLPYVGRTRRYQNLCIATGHAMMGLSLGPITGRLLAEILSGEKPSIDLRLLDPDRYG